MSDDRQQGPCIVVTLRGVAGPTVRCAFDDDVEVIIDGTTTRLRSPTADQSSLQGILQRAQDLGMEVIEVRVESVETD